MAITLTSLVTRFRNRLDDAVVPYLWSNDELTDYLNEIVNDLCRDIPILEDATTAAVCQYAITAGVMVVTLHARITVLKKARLTSQTRLLDLRTAQYMDAVYPGWESSAAGTPTILVTEGVGTGKVKLYPPSTVNETLNLTVYRLPVADLVWASDQAVAPELPELYHDKLMNGILWKAYSKQDVDTYDARKRDSHERMWRIDREEIRRAVLKTRQRPEIVVPLQAMI